MTEDAKTAETQAAAATEQVEKTPEQLEAEAAAKKAKQEAKKKAAAEQKAAKEMKKQERLRKRQEEEAKKNEFVKDPNDPCADKFGDLELNRSQCDPETRFTKQYTKLEQLDASKADQEVRVRCRVHNSRKQGAKMCFVVGREVYSTVQAVLF